MDKLPKELTLEQVREACAVLGLPFDKLARVSMMPDAVVVDHMVTTDAGRTILATASITVTR